MTDRYERIRAALADMDAAAEARNALAWRDAHARFVVHVAPDTIRELLAERDQLSAAQAETRELRAALTRVRELAAKWRSAPQNPDEPILAMAADELDAAIQGA